MGKHITLFLLVFMGFCASAQTINTTGIVKDAASGDVLPGVSIIIKGSTNGTQTDFDGLYTLSNLQPNAVLVFRYLGYKQKEVSAKNGVLDVTLEIEAQSLDEIVLIGYGSQRKKETTGAVSVVSSQTIEDLKPTRIEQALQGQVAGVNITSTSGAPGAASSIRIRGVSTNGDNQPLILVDGNRIEDLSVINPSDIESINILKDATAGIYGVLAANGVIIITTKSGRKNTDLKVVLNSYTGLQNTTREIPLLNATEYALLANEAHGANGEALPFTNIAALGQGTDWQDEVFQTASISNTDITISKGTEKSTYSFGASYLDQDGIVGGGKANFNRLTARFNFNTDLFKNLKFTSSSVYMNTNKKGLSENTLGSVLFNALNMPSNLTPRVGPANVQYTLAPNSGVGIEVINPLAQIEDSYNKAWVNKFSGSYGLNYSFLEHFSVESRIQFNEAKVTSKVYTPEVFYGNSKVFNNGDLEDDINNSGVFEGEQTYRDYTFDAFVKYEQNINDIHDIKLLLGTSVYRSQGINNVSLTGFGANGNSLSNVNVDEADSFQDNLELSNAPRQFFDDRLLSYFSRLQYNYKSKYLFSAVLRRDGSSNFGPENKFGFFPSGSVGWVASEETFLKDSDVINFLKFRASYGIIGNARIGSFGFVSTMSGEGVYVFDDALAFGSAEGTLANPQVRWEKQKPLDFGVDMKLFNKIDITADYFSKTTEDLLIRAEVSGILGVSAPGSGVPTINAGTILNEGLEFSIAYKERVSDDFKFAVSYNFTTLKNEVLKVNLNDDPLTVTGFGLGGQEFARMEVGLPIGYFYGYQTAGIFQTQAEVDAHASQTNANPGDLRFADLNGDGEITPEDRTNLGDPIPELTMGMNFSFDYKSFDFNMYAFASLGNDMVRNYERNLALTNRPAYFLDRWTGPGTSNTFPRVTTGATGNTLFSDFYVEDGSFVRLQNVQVGYSFNAINTTKLGVDKLRLYLSASNLFTLTKYKGYDPVASNGNPLGGGLDNGFYPPAKTFLLGLNVNF